MPEPTEFQESLIMLSNTLLLYTRDQEHGAYYNAFLGIYYVPGP